MQLTLIILLVPQSLCSKCCIDCSFRAEFYSYDLQLLSKILSQFVYLRSKQHKCDIKNISSFSIIILILI